MENNEDNMLLNHQAVNDYQKEIDENEAKEKYAKEIFFPDFKLYEIMRFGGNFLPFDKQDKLSYFYVVISGHI